MIPVTPPGMIVRFRCVLSSSRLLTSLCPQGQEVWARMPGRLGDPMGVESNVELMGFVLGEYWLTNQKVS
jgi:hypothetical protein